MRHLLLVLAIPFVCLPQAKDAVTKLAGQVDATRYGCIADGSTDNTTCVNNALAAIYANGGGALWFCGAQPFRINSKITFPNNGGSVPTFQQPPMRLTGCGDNAGNRTATGQGGILDLRYSGTGGQIVSLASGYLEIDHIGLKNGATGGGNTTPFLLITNTTANIHDISIIGDTTLSGASNIQDAIWLGGGGDVPSTAEDSSFAGYGTVINANWFNHVQRVLYLFSGPSWSVNGIQVTNNTIWAQSGSSDATNGAAIDFSVLGGQVGNYFAGNLLEGTYKWFFRVNTNSNRNAFVFNSVFDNVDTAIYRFENGTSENFILHHWTTTRSGAIMSEQNPGNNTLLTSDASYVSKWPNPITFGVVTASSAITTPVAVASLPTCNSGAAGSHAAVTDSNAASFTAGIGAVVANGGSTKVPVYCDGTNWRIG